jgi:hypothetical protein
VTSTSIDDYLTHSWSFDCGTMFDEIGSANMTQGQGTYFVEDRFCNPYSALALNGGWAQIPPEVYFDTPEFTISVWVYPQSVESYARIIDFGNGPNDNIIFSLSYDQKLTPIIFFSAKFFVSSAMLSLGKWQFLVATFNRTRLNIYKDGIPIYSNKSLTFSNQAVYRNNCYVGKSNWPTDGFSYSYLDDLRFYNSSLSRDEIIQIMNENKENGKY